ncbi:MAG: hypothetical protein WD673_15020 [Alphaproteobacteria bacterium]
MWWLLVWIVSAFVAAAIHGGRGHSWFAGFVVGLIFGPLGVVLALLSRRTGAAIADEARAQGRVPCPHCAEFIMRAAKVCPHCGRDPAPPPTKMARALTAMEQERRHSGIPRDRQP